MKRLSTGVMYMIVATFSVAVMQALVKVLAEVPVIQIVFCRSAFSLIITFLIIQSGKISFKVTSPSLIVFRGLLGLGSLVTFFYTLHHVPLATAVTIGNLAPLFLGLLAGYFLREKIGLVHWVSLFIAFAGVLIIKGFDSRVNSLDAFIALLSAFLTASAHFSLRLLKNENTAVVLFYFSLVVVIVLGPALFWEWKNPDINEWLLLIMVMVLSHIGQWSLTTALKSENIGHLLSFYYLGFLLSMVIGYFLFKETFNYLTITGMIFIFWGIIMPQYFKKS